MARSLNRVQLIGNLTRDPELRYTPNGSAVCSFGLATNRSWKTDTGEKHDEAEFHNIVAWNKLAEICSQFLVKGRKVYLEGRLATRSWTGQDGAQRSRTEIVISDMILLDSRRPDASAGVPETAGPEVEAKKAAASAKGSGPLRQSVSEASEPEEEKLESQENKEDSEKKTPSVKSKDKGREKEATKPSEDEVVPDDIPF